MKAYKDLTNMKFGRLTVLGEGPKDEYNRRKWWCECSCEDHTRLLVSSAKLLSGNTRSCGCLQRETVAARNSKHGFRHHPLYGTHKTMKHRGIPIYENWLGNDGIKNFIDWAENEGGWKPNTRLYRKDLNIGFYPENLEFKPIKHRCPELVPRRMDTSDMLNKTFGMLTVIAFAGSHPRRDGEKVRYWLCECSCPAHNRIVTSTDKLVSGKKADCGCVAARKAAKLNNNDDNIESILNKDDIFVSLPNEVKYKAYRRLADIHRKMCQRCYDETSKDYCNYGARGISVKSEWHDQTTGVANFILWALRNGYDDNLTLDRIDNNKDYGPENCRWATKLEQNNNKRSNKLIYDLTEWLTYRQFEEKYNQTPSAVSIKLSRGWSIDAIVYDAQHKTDVRRVHENYYENGCPVLIPRIAENHLSDDEKYERSKKPDKRVKYPPRSYEEYLKWRLQNGKPI